MGENLVLAALVIVPGASGALLVWLYRQVRRQTGPAPWPLVFLGNVLLLLLLLGAGALGGELYYRFLYDSTDSMMFNKVSQRWFTRYYHWNRANLRDDLEYSLHIAPGRRRVSFVGDSFTAGHGIKDTQERFANIIRNKHQEWEVHVLAMLGFNTQDEMDYLAGWLHKDYQLDEVVLVYCLNDIGDLIPQEVAAVTQAYAESKRGGWFCRNSYLVNTLYFRFKFNRDPALKAVYDYERAAYQDGPVWEAQKLRLRAFRDLVESHGGRLAVVTFPYFNMLGPHYQFEFAHKRLDDFWRSLSVPNVDLLPAYGGIAPEKLMVNRFDAHPNEYANALAAPLIEKMLLEQLSPGR